MSFDFSTVLLDPIYNSDLAVDAVLTLEGGSDTFALRVLDKTGAVTVGANVDVPTVLPQACIRYSELIAYGLNKNDLINGTLELNGFEWTISNIRPDPTPSGERSGEVYVNLQNQSELASSES